MLGYVIFGIMAAISIPLVFIFATKPKANQTNIVKYPIGIPVICFILIGSLAVFTLIDTIEKKAFDDLSFMIPLSTSLFLTFGWLANMAVSYRLEVFDDHFVYRNVLWGKRKYRYDEITGMKWPKKNEIVIRYYICIGKKKIGIDNTMINFSIIDRKLRKEGVFRKFSPKKRHQCKH